MARRRNPYEAAFEEFLRASGIPYVATDEARRTIAGDASLKSLDFIVSPPQGQRLLVDVKGRRFPTAKRKQYWKNWSTAEDLRALAQWQDLFGSAFDAVLVFAYHVVGDRAPLPPEDLFVHQDQIYGFIVADHKSYGEFSRQISPQWDTVAVSTSKFREIARPLSQVLGLKAKDRVA
jgi:hypothetical protein